jgi:hypothetical protein
MSYKDKYLKYKKKYNNLLNGKKIQTGGNTLDTDDIKRLFKLYLHYYSDTVLKNNLYIINSIHSDYNKIITYRDYDEYVGIKIFENMEVDYSMDQIEDNYEKYKIIILRDPTKSKNLLVGCGTKPLIELADHQHPDFTTINPEISINPTIVGALGADPGIEQFFIDNNYKFDNFYAEAVTLASNETIANNIADILDKIMITDYGVYEFPDEFFGVGRAALLKSNIII